MPKPTTQAMRAARACWRISTAPRTVEDMAVLIDQKTRLPALIEAAKVRIDEVETEALAIKDGMEGVYPRCIEDPCGSCSFCWARAALQDAEESSVEQVMQRIRPKIIDKQAKIIRALTETLRDIASQERNSHPMVKSMARLARAALLDLDLLETEYPTSSGKHPQPRAGYEARESPKLDPRSSGELGHEDLPKQDAVPTEGGESPDQRSGTEGSSDA